MDGTNRNDCLQGFLSIISHQILVGKIKLSSTAPPARNRLLSGRVALATGAMAELSAYMPSCVNVCVCVSVSVSVSVCVCVCVFRLLVLPQLVFFFQLLVFAVFWIWPPNLPFALQ